LRIDEIEIPDNRQRREMGDIEIMAESLVEFGQLQPIVVSKNVLVIGERRLQAARLLGWEEIAVVEKDDLSEVEKLEVELEENIRRKDLTHEEKRKAIAIIYEMKKAKGGSIRSIQEQLGMKKSTIHDALKMAKAYEAIPGLKKVKTAHKARKLVQAFEEKAIKQEIVKRRMESNQNEENFVLSDARDYIKSLEDGSIDVVLTDPPFGVDIERQKKNSTGKIYDKFDKASILFELLEEVVPELYRVMKKDSHLFMFFAIQFYQRLKDLLTKEGFDVCDIPLVWYKGRVGQCQRPEKWLGSSYETCFFAHKGFLPLALPGRSNVFVYEGDKPGEKDHPFQKPIKLLRDILNISSLAGATMLDPFAGTASSLIAARKNQMNFYGCEISPDWFAMGQYRLDLYK